MRHNTFTLIYAIIIPQKEVIFRKYLFKEIENRNILRAKVDERY